MNDFQYQSGQRFQWVQPEESMGAISAGRPLHRNGPIVEEIVLVMEKGPMDFLPHIAVITGGACELKYPAYRCFCVGPLIKGDSHE